VRERVGGCEFLGYEMERAEAVVTAMIKDGTEIRELDAGETGAIVCNQTPFYGESGGQVGDTGVIRTAQASFKVTDTQKKADGLFIHFGHVAQGAFAVGDAVEMVVDGRRRSAIRPIIPRPISFMRRCARCSARMWRKKARSSRMSVCGSIFPIQNR